MVLFAFVAFSLCLFQEAQMTIRAGSFGAHHCSSCCCGQMTVVVYLKKRRGKIVNAIVSLLLFVIALSLIVAVEFAKEAQTPLCGTELRRRRSGICVGQHPRRRLRLGEPVKPFMLTKPAWKCSKNYGEALPPSSRQAMAATP
jgi:hypothetical protein